MKHSTDRILVSHVGSLARPKDLMEMLVARNEGKPYDSVALAKRTRESVAEVVQKQIDCGIDVVNDGELGKSNFSRYTKERLGGFVEREAGADFKPTSIFGRDMKEFTEYFNRGGRTAIGHHARVFYCVEPLKYVGQDEVNADIANLKAALQGKQYDRGISPAIAPGTMEHWMKNEYYKTTEEYLFAIAEAMHEEYKAIVDAGFVLQIDDPDLADAWQMHPEMSLADYRKYQELRIDALNHALARIARRSHSLSHVLGQLPRAAQVRHSAQGHRRSDSQGESQRLFHRGVQSLPRSRVARLARRETARRQDAHARRHRPLQRLHRTSAGDRRSFGALRQNRREGKRHRRHRLRHRLAGRPPAGRLGEVSSDGRRRAHRDQRVVGEIRRDEG